MGYEWFKLHSKGWLTGSIRSQLTPAERSVWADLLALANESRIRGIICRALGIPYTREYLAQYFLVPLEVLNSTIEKCSQDKNTTDGKGRIELDSDGCIIITNWKEYQAVPIERVRLDARGRELRNRKLVRQYTQLYPDEAADALMSGDQFHLLNGKYKKEEGDVEET